MKKALFILLFFSATILSQSQSVWTNIKERGADATGMVKCTKVISDVISELSAKGGELFSSLPVPSLPGR